MSLIQCHFDYASSAWYNGLNQELKNKLQVTQNKIIRFVLNLHPRSHIGKQQFLSLHWLPVHNRVSQITLCHVFKINNNLAPSYLNDKFTLVTDFHNKNTRFRVKAKSVAGDYFNSDISMEDSKRYIPPSVKGFGKRSFAYNGCSLWNSLPQHVRDASNIPCFKAKVKEHFFSNLDF